MVDIEPLSVSLSQRFSGRTRLPDNTVGLLRLGDIVGIRRVALERFRAKWIPVRVKKTRQNENPEPRSDSIGTEKALWHERRMFAPALREHGSIAA